MLASIGVSFLARYSRYTCIDCSPSVRPMIAFTAIRHRPLSRPHSTGCSSWYNPIILNRFTSMVVSPSSSLSLLDVFRFMDVSSPSLSSDDTADEAIFERLLRTGENRHRIPNSMALWYHVNPPQLVMKKEPFWCMMRIKMISRI